MSVVEEVEVMKLREFPAHSDTVNCVVLGPRSGNVAITGGQDKKVNMWCANRPNCLGSLQGHTSPVTSVGFSRNELQACAGSEAGVLKVWDMNSSKLLRTLTGHRGRIKCLDFDQDGESLVSGSGDSVIKLWDTRKKACVLSYQGYPGSSVTSVKFSPCSQFIASGASDSGIKLWDLRTGKLLHDLQGHSGHINHLAFNPSSSQLMFSASMDRSVKCYNWKIGTELSSSTEGEIHITRRLFCQPNQKSVLAAGENFVSLFADEQLDSSRWISSPWGKVHDLVIPLNHADTAFAVTSRWNSITFFKVSLSSFIPRTPYAPRIESKHSSPEDIRPVTGNHKGKSDVIVTAETPFETVFTPNQDLLRTPPKEQPDEKQNVLDQQMDSADCHPHFPFSDSPPINSHETSNIVNIFEDKVTTTANISSEFVSANSSLSSSSYESPVFDHSDVSGDVKTYSLTPLSSNITEIQVQSKADTTKCVSPRPCSVKDAAPCEKKVLKSQKTFVVETSSADRLSLLGSQSQNVCSQLRSRLIHLQQLHKVWTTKDKLLTTHTAISSPDITILVHYLDIVKTRNSFWDLDICVIIVPSLSRLISSSCESHILTACSIIKLILNKFSPLITSTVSVLPSVVGVDICQEERRKKCIACCKELNVIRKIFQERPRGSPRFRGKSGQAIKEILPLFNSLPQHHVAHTRSK